MEGNRIERIISSSADFLDKILVFLSVSVIGLLTVNMIIGVFFRYILGQPIFWVDELSLILFAWSTFLGGSLAVKRSEMAAVTIVFDKLPPLLQKYVSLFLQITILVFGALVTYYSYIWINNPSVMNMISPTLRINMWIVYLVVPLGMISIMVFSIDNIVRILSNKNTAN